MPFTEANYENAIIEVFQTILGYRHIYGPDVIRDYTDPLFKDDLLPALKRINPELPEVAINEAKSKLYNIENGTRLQKNVQFMDYLQTGISVTYYIDKQEQSALVYLVDYVNIDNNTFTVINQWTVSDKSIKRPDLIVFLNGLPVVVFELKSPSREETDASEAYNQLRNYMKEIPSLFIYNAFCVMSDLAISKAGTITSDEDRYMEWKTKDGSYENTKYAQFDTFIEGIFDKTRLLDILKNFICFSDETKILAAYHQYFAVRKAINSTIKATETDGRGGVFWHTQGSGKSLSMVFYAHLLQEALNLPTIVVLTDQNDLDDQLFKQFSKCQHFLRQKPEQATSRNDLKKRLKGRKASGIIFTTMQKFTESSEPLSQRRNIIVLADEAHRGQYGLMETVNPKTGHITIGIARKIRNSLPEATYIGFTGTPISYKDRSTIEEFGDCIDIYDMTQSVEDGATRPIYYESRVIHLKLKDDILKLIDAEYDILATSSEPYAIQKSKQDLSRVESILGAEQTLDALCEDIVTHYKENRQHILTGKALIAAYSRPIAIKIYHKLLSMRPHWVDKICIVMTTSNKDPEEWIDLIGNKRHRNQMAEKFKDNDSSLKIAIVVDMWLTGFDVPSLATMYVYKPMARHNLMQAIARVNRVYQDKPGGLIIDYVGIASALKQAMHDYTNRDKQNYGEQDIAKTVLLKFVEKLEICRDLFHGFDYSMFLSPTATDLMRSQAISGGANFISAVESYSTSQSKSQTSRKETFIKEAMLLRQALSLCRSILTFPQRFEAEYFEAVRTIITRISSEGKPLSLKEINARINELLKASIQSDGVINLFSDVEIEFSLFDPKFIEEIAKMKERNLVVEMLRKLLADKVSLYRKKDVVLSEKFSEMLKEAMNAYINGLITNEEVIAELIRIAKEMASASAEGDMMGLNEEELAFYHALTHPKAVKDFYSNKVLIEMTHELTDTLRRNRTIDWHKKDSSRAGMRRLVKKLLKRYKYPPEGEEEAIETVISQCEMWTDNEYSE